MHCSYKRRCIRCSPGRLRQRIIRLRIISQQVLDGTRSFLKPPRHIEEVHLIVLVSDLVGQTTCPSFNLVEFVLLFIVTCFAHIHFFVLRKTARSAFAVTGYKHDEASVHNLVNNMVAILACFNHLVFEKVLLKSMYCLFWTVVPAGVDTVLARLVNIGAINLSNDGFGQIIRISDVYPIACATVLATAFRDLVLGTHQFSRPHPCDGSLERVCGHLRLRIGHLV